jgi:two-component sensor histidine kinase
MRTDGRLILEVADNGPGSKTSNSGTGTVVIDAWLSKLGGIKEIESIPGAGYTLRIMAPVNKFDLSRKY